ncbi:DUF2946 family protein [Lacisediminimonas profundi]|uniref:DUF2946 family protein n=1 Tax=Lacisediminimonas profundi TaxID=2603856 RepID=UPI001386BE0C|nr:DUF2946 family protein [Lacisediminimonas profundi]
MNHQKTPCALGSGRFPFGGARRSARRRCTAWLACLALLWSALLPSLSQAASLAGSQESALLQLIHGEVCSTSAPASGRGDPAAPAPAGDLSQSHSHCSLCLTGGPLAAPPAMPVQSSAAPVRRLPRLYYQSPSPLFSWQTARSRAPPTA